MLLCFLHSCLKPCLMPPELLPRALLGAVVGFPALFLDMVGLIFTYSTPPPAPRTTNFHHILDTSSKSSPRGCRGISCSVFGHGWTHGCAFDPPASPEENDVSSYFGHFFQELSSALSLDFLALFGDIFGFVFAPSTPPPAPMIAFFASGLGLAFKAIGKPSQRIPSRSTQRDAPPVLRAA